MNLSSVLKLTLAVQISLVKTENQFISHTLHPAPLTDKVSGGTHG